MVGLLSNYENTGTAEVVRLLYERGADINAKLYDGNTPLYLAASIGNFPELLKKKKHFN